MIRAGIVGSVLLIWLAPAIPRQDGAIDTVRERARVLGQAARFLKDAPVTVTSSRSPRSAGGPHDYFS